MTFAAVAVAFTLASTPNVTAHEIVSGDLTIAHPTARPNLPNRPTAAYMVIRNDGDTDDRLVSAKSDVFGKIELHTVIKDGDVMKMQPVTEIIVPAGGETALEAGGLHLMLFDAAERQKDGTVFPLTLTFSQAGDVDVMVKVDRRAGRGHDHDHSDHGTKAPKGSDDGHSGHKHGGHKHDSGS